MLGSYLLPSFRPKYYSYFCVITFFLAICFSLTPSKLPFCITILFITSFSARAHFPHLLQLTHSVLITMFFANTQSSLFLFFSFAPLHLPLPLYSAHNNAALTDRDSDFFLPSHSQRRRETVKVQIIEISNHSSSCSFFFITPLLPFLLSHHHNHPFHLLLLYVTHSHSSSFLSIFSCPFRPLPSASLTLFSCSFCLHIYLPTFFFFISPFPPTFTSMFLCSHV